MYTPSSDNEVVKQFLLTDDGIFYKKSVLWLDSYANGNLTFLSSALFSSKKFSQQVIATEETVKLLEALERKPNALICQYNRPFSIGKLQLELIPSGTSLGGSLLHIEADRKKILYAPHVQIKKIGLMRQLQTKSSDTLILGAFESLNMQHGISRKKEKLRLVETVGHAIENHSVSTIYCQETAIAVELMQLLSENEIPVAVNRSIYKILKTYESFGYNAGPYTQISSTKTDDKVKILPLAKIKNTSTEMNRVYLNISDPNQTFNTPLNSFSINHTTHINYLSEFISQINPNLILFFGPYAKDYVKKYKNQPVTALALQPNFQTLLF